MRRPSPWPSPHGGGDRNRVVSGPGAQRQPRRPLLRGVTLAGGMTLLALMFGFLSGAARAQVIQPENDRYRSPQHFAVELRLGPYRPNIDSEFDGGATPHANFFGSGRRLMTQVEVDYQFIRHVGSVGVGLGIGYFTEEGQNRILATSELSDDKTTLRLIPLSLSLVYRFDLPYEQWGFPLVPYGKAGLDYALWSITNGNGDVPEDPTGARVAGGPWAGTPPSGCRWC